MNAMDNFIGRVPLLPRYILAALVLCGLILATVVQRAAILRSGQEARLEIVPVDPRASVSRRLCRSQPIGSARSIFRRMQ